MNTKPLSPALFRNLPEQDFEGIQKHARMKKDEAYLNEIIFLLNLCQNIADQYPEKKDAFLIAIRGMVQGIINYRDNHSKKDDPPPFSTYLTWFMKTAIEYEMDMDNEDTRAWHWD